MLETYSNPNPSPAFTIGAKGAPEPTVEGAMQLYDAWASVMASKPQSRRRLNTVSVEHYRTQWHKWAQYLSGRQLNWHSASSDDITQYLNQVQPRAQARRKASNAAAGEASDVTVRRYWRVLRDIYQHALFMRWIVSNPCEEALEVPRSENTDSMILPPWALKVLHEGIVGAHDRRSDPSWREIRDDALLLFMLHTAAKTSEVQQLRLDHMFQGESKTHATHFRVNFEGQRSCQKRQIPLLDKDLARIFSLWIEVRMKVDACPPWLFFSQKTEAAGDGRQRSKMSKKSIFLLVSGTIQRMLPRENFEGMLAHVGGETLRNSVLANWIENGLSLQEVKERAGVAELRAITRVNRNSQPNGLTT